MVAGRLFRFAGIVVMVLGLLAGPVHAQILEDYEEADGPVSLSVTAGDILWWEEVQGAHILPDMAITLQEEAADALLAASENHVGEKMAFYLDGKYIATFVIPDVMADGVLRFRYEADAQARLQPLLPVLTGQKPVVRIIRAR